MEPSEAITFVRRFNAWRRCDEDSEQPHPREIGQALDALCNHAERLERELCDARAELATARDTNEDMRDLLREIYNLTTLERDCPIDLPHRALIHIGHIIEEKTPPTRAKTESLNKPKP